MTTQKKHNTYYGVWTDNTTESTWYHAKSYPIQQSDLASISLLFHEVPNLAGQDKIAKLEEKRLDPELLEAIVLRKHGRRISRI